MYNLTYPLHTKSQRLANNGKGHFLRSKSSIAVIMRKLCVCSINCGVDEALYQNPPQMQPRSVQ